MLVYGMLYKKGQKRKNWNMRLYVRLQDSLPHNLRHGGLRLPWYLNRLFRILPSYTTMALFIFCLYLYRKHVHVYVHENTLIL